VTTIPQRYGQTDG